MWLKISNAGYSQMDVIPPSGNNRIGINPRVPPSLKEGQESLPHGILQFPTPRREARNNRIADECIGVLYGVSAGGSVTISRPESCSRNPACSALVSGLFPKRNFNLSKGHVRHLQLPHRPIGLEVNARNCPGALKGERFPVGLDAGLEAVSRG